MIRWSSVLASWLALIVFLWGLTARADDDLLSAPPRDVGVLVQPSGAKLPPAPSDFQRLEHGWLTIEYPSTIRERMQGIVRELDEQRGRLSGDFGQPELPEALVRIGRSPEQMAELAPEGAPPPPYAAGVAYPSAHLALATLQAPRTWDAPDLGETLRHELGHLALYDALEGHHVPRWFDEGLAIHESGELPWARRMALAEASLGKRLLPLADLDRGFPADHYEVNVAYAESADFVSFLLRDVDRARFGSLVERVRAGTSFERALEDAYGTDTRKLEYEWREGLTRRFSIVPALTSGGALWGFTVVLATAAWMKRRKRAREKLARWAREEAEMEAALVAQRETPQQAAATAPAEEPMPSGPTRGIPVVEHQGRWYTVH